MTLKEIMEKSKQNNRGYIKRKSSLEKNDYFCLDSHLSAIDNNGYLKVFTNEELMATDWEILDWETLNA